ncbi:hypothetical protein [Bacillus marinisedimentorum]|uniref:hypothetical protein n=1 Tax=Bacillus marinisedimentorum TaxID=1821260 RepID=UPI0008726B4A|nr:hypothetical protein [Bacillus marinisedimentorum]
MEEAAIDLLTFISAVVVSGMFYRRMVVDIKLLKKRKQDISGLFPVDTTLTMQQWKFLKENLSVDYFNFYDYQRTIYAGEILYRIEYRRISEETAKMINTFYKGKSA